MISGTSTILHRILRTYHSQQPSTLILTGSNHSCSFMILLLLHLISIHLVVGLSPLQSTFTSTRWYQQRHRSIRRTDTILFDDKQNSKSYYNHESKNYFERIIRRSGEGYFQKRLITIPVLINKNFDSTNVPVINMTTMELPSTFLAEVYVSGQGLLVQIVSAIMKSLHTEPKFQVKILSAGDGTMNNTDPNQNMDSTSVPAGVASTPPLLTIDIGQITTIWEFHRDTYGPENDIKSVLSIFTIDSIPIKHATDVESVMEILYKSRSTSSSTSSSSIVTNKKAIEQLIEKECVNINERERIESIFRKIFKAGKNYHRIIDSSMVVPYLRPAFISDDIVSAAAKSFHNYLMQRATAALLLANDAKQGGRFKRWPCMYVSTSSIHQDTETIPYCTISLINGGWFVTDSTVRTNMEAQKFVERRNGAIIDQRNNLKALTTRTVADERIYRRLECLAMGELFQNSNGAGYKRDRDHSQQATTLSLELDVREVLRAMNLSEDPVGAKEALIRTGYWSDDASKHKNLGEMIQPWSQSVLDAAKLYLRNMMSNCHDPARVDLTNIPCICIDAIRTTFRDDAIGIRLRSSTGRTVLPDASKWEVLIHISDVSDIYSIPPLSPSSMAIDSPLLTLAKSQNELSLLRNASARRGSSRYDLPLGPLHLLPPIVLQALSFSSSSPSNHGKDDDQKKFRAVTVWAYIDERNGNLIDFGIERTFISSPIQLSFHEATTFLENSEISNVKKGKQVQALLIVLDRSLNLWENKELNGNTIAQKRESRLSTREQHSSMYTATSKNESQWKKLRDDGVDGFRRSRGHRLVDTALNLYTKVAVQLIERKKAPIPRAIGADASRGGRVGTAPLRRYIDGQIQRQLLAVLCNYGVPMTFEECKEASLTANKANNSIKNIRSVRKREK